jgi:hypothetical protein
MTTFTTEDRERAIKIVQEAPYHPGYEDAVIIPETVNPLMEELNELRKWKERHLNTAKGIVQFYKDKQKKN